MRTTSVACGRLEIEKSNGKTVINGFVGKPDDLEKVRKLAAQSDVQVKVLLRPWPQCETLMTIEKPLARADRPSISLPKQSYEASETLGFEVRMQGFQGYLHVAYELTQFTRALKTLDIQPIHAHTPTTPTPSCPSTWPITTAASPGRRTTPKDAHRRVLHDAASVDLILSLHSTRKLSRNLTLRYQNREYQILNQGKGYRLRSSPVTVCEGFEGHVTLGQGQTLDYRVLTEGWTPVPLDDEKSLHRTVDSARALQRKRPKYKPSPDHPWNRWKRLQVPPQPL